VDGSFLHRMGAHGVRRAHSPCRMASHALRVTNSGVPFRPFSSTTAEPPTRRLRSRPPRIPPPRGALFLAAEALPGPSRPTFSGIERAWPQIFESLSLFPARCAVPSPIRAPSPPSRQAWSTPINRHRDAAIAIFWSCSFKSALILVIGISGIIGPNLTDPIFVVTLTRTLDQHSLGPWSR
jgi:hypothetical protein